MVAGLAAAAGGAGASSTSNMLGAAANTQLAVVRPMDTDPHAGGRRDRNNADAPATTPSDLTRPFSRARTVQEPGGGTNLGPAFEHSNLLALPAPPPPPGPPQAPLPPPGPPPPAGTATATGTCEQRRLGARPACGE